MERLTQMVHPGLGYCWTKLAFSDVAIMEDMIIDRLGAYEDTGLTPEEIMVMQKEKLERDKGCEYSCGKHYTERKQYVTTGRDENCFISNFFHFRSLYILICKLVVASSQKERQ